MDQVGEHFLGLSKDIRRIVSELAMEPLAEVEALNAELNAYKRQLQHSGNSAEFLDRDTAEKVANLCDELIQLLRDIPTKKNHLLVQIAVRYFILEEDAEDDNDSLIGFDDDLDVALAVSLAIEAEGNKGRFKRDG